MRRGFRVPEIVAALLPLWLAFAPALADEEAIFPMQEVSVFDGASNSSSARGTPGSDLRQLVRGQAAECTTEPDDEVKAYPPLKSKQPYYGTVTFDRSYFDPDSGVEFHFVVDESGETAPDPKGEPDRSETPEKTSLLKQLSAALLGGDATPPNEEARPKLPPITYDRLYFDLNRDLDLTNDPVLVPMREPPDAAIPAWEAKQKVVFEHLRVPFDYGPDLGQRPFEIVPRLIISESKGKEYASLYFTATTARQGTIRMGEREYDAIVGQPYLISGRLDRPYTAIYLQPRDREAREPYYWWGSDEICALRRVDGKLYTTRVSPLGDKLFVRPYEGGFGVLEIGPGGRTIEADKLGVSGGLKSESAAVAVGTLSEGSSSLEGARQCELPVGDYLPNYVSVEYGDLRLGISMNYHSDGHPRDRQGKPPVFGIKIREGKPFVWDFSNKPEVMFASPAKDEGFAPGDEISVKAILTDPVLDIMIRRLEDTSRSKEETIDYGDGRTSTYRRPHSLDPTVTITNASGEKVAEGTMPFG